MHRIVIIIIMYATDKRDQIGSRSVVVTITTTTADRCGQSITDNSWINLGVSFASANTTRNIIDLGPSVVCTPACT